MLVNFAVASPAAGADDRSIAVDNRSAKTVKVVAPGGAAIVEAEAEPVTVTVAAAGGADAEDAVGVEVTAWWVSEPRQLCQIFTPWGRTVIVSGSRTIRCRSR